MTFVPHRGDGPPRFGPEVQQIPDIGPATLDAAVYTDPDRYERERERVLRRSWMIVGRSSEVPEPGDYLVWEGHGESIVVTRRADGALSGFHNVCQHRGARIVQAGGKGGRRFTCRWHGWSYDPEGAVVGVPDRRDFDAEHLQGLCSPPVACDEWGGWIWAVLDGPGAAPPLLDWLGPDVVGDLGAYRMEDMRLVEKLVFDLPVNWKAVVDGFNEVYHAAHLHTITPQDVKDGRHSTFFDFGRHSMMVVPFKGTLEELRETGDHQSTAICHYTIFPNAVFNNNPNHVQLFHSVPLAFDRTRFECWELWYDEDDPTYLAGVEAHWERLKAVVEEDVWIYREVAAVAGSVARQRSILSERECKITAFHRTCARMLDEPG